MLELLVTCACPGRDKSAALTFLCWSGTASTARCQEKLAAPESSQSFGLRAASLESFPVRSRTDSSYHVGYRTIPVP